MTSEQAGRPPVPWPRVEQIIELPSWAEVLYGMEHGHCGIDVAVGYAERCLLTSSDPRIVDVAIEEDWFYAIERIRALAEHEVAGRDPARLWFYLLVAEIRAQESTVSASEVLCRLEDVWMDFDYPSGLSFVVPWMPGDERPSVWQRFKWRVTRYGGLDSEQFWSKVRPRLDDWLRRERDALSTIGSSPR